MTVLGRIRRRAVKIAIDTALLVAFVLVFVSRERSFDADYVLHGTVGLVLVPILALHLGSNWGWVRRLASRRRRDRDARLAMLNLVFGAATAVCVLSGIPLWGGWVEADALVATHSATGMTSILLVLVHLVWNQRRFRSLIGLHRTGAPSDGDLVSVSPGR